MNKKYECDIVKDLASLHIENMLSSNSKDFVEKHLLNCDDCKEYYNDMSFNIFNEEKKEKKKDEVELDHLRKVKKRITTFKIILTIIIWLILFVIFFCYGKSVYIAELMQPTMNKLFEMKNSDNYKLVHKTIYKDYIRNTGFDDEITYYYKDGKYKEDSGQYVKYEEDGKNETITIHHDLTQIEYYNRGINRIVKGEKINILISRLVDNQMGINNLNVTSRTEKYNDIECFVIRVGNEKQYYREVWIDKERNELIRVFEAQVGNYSREELFELSENTVVDKDVDSSIVESEMYKNYFKIKTGVLPE